MSPRTVLAILGGLILSAAVGVVATVLTITGEREDPACSDRAYGCAEFLPGEPVRVGLLAPLGPADKGGQEPRRGALLAIARAGPFAGRSIELVVHDDGCSVKGTAAAARELASDPPFEPPVVAVVHDGCGRGVQPAVQILSDSGISLLTAQVVAVAFQDPPRSFLVRAPVGQPSRAFERRYEARYGSRPVGVHAWFGYNMTRHVLAEAERLAVGTSDGRLLIPKTQLHRRLSDF